MNKEEVLAVAAKYRKMSDNEMFYGEEKCREFEQIAECIENDVDVFVNNPDFETKEDVVENVKEFSDPSMSPFDFNDFDDDDSFDEE